MSFVRPRRRTTLKRRRPVRGGFRLNYGRKRYAGPTYSGYGAYRRRRVARRPRKRFRRTGKKKLSGWYFGGGISRPSAIPFKKPYSFTKDKFFPSQPSAGGYQYKSLKYGPPELPSYAWNPGAHASSSSGRKFGERDWGIMDNQRVNYTEEDLSNIMMGIDAAGVAAGVGTIPKLGYALGRAAYKGFMPKIARSAIKQTGSYNPKTWFRNYREKSPWSPTSRPSPESLGKIDKIATDMYKSGLSKPPRKLDLDQIGTTMSPKYKDSKAIRKPPTKPRYRAGVDQYPSTIKDINSIVNNPNPTRGTIGGELRRVKPVNNTGFTGLYVYHIPHN